MGVISCKCCSSISHTKSQTMLNESTAGPNTLRYTSLKPRKEMFFKKRNSMDYAVERTKFNNQSTMQDIKKRRSKPHPMNVHHHQQQDQAKKTSIFPVSIATKPSNKTPSFKYRADSSMKSDKSLHRNNYRIVINKSKKDTGASLHNDKVTKATPKAQISNNKIHQQQTKTTPYDRLRINQSSTRLETPSFNVLTSVGNVIPVIKKREESTLKSQIKSLGEDEEEDIFLLNSDKNKHSSSVFNQIRQSPIQLSFEKYDSQLQLPVADDLPKIIVVSNLEANKSNNSNKLGSSLVEKRDQLVNEQSQADFLANTFKKTKTTVKQNSPKHILQLLKNYETYDLSPESKKNSLVISTTSRKPGVNGFTENLSLRVQTQELSQMSEDAFSIRGSQRSFAEENKESSRHQQQRKPSDFRKSMKQSSDITMNPMLFDKQALESPLESIKSHQTKYSKMSPLTTKSQMKLFYPQLITAMQQDTSKHGKPDLSINKEESARSQLLSVRNTDIKEIIESAPISNSNIPEITINNNRVIQNLESESENNVQNTGTHHETLNTSPNQYKFNGSPDIIIIRPPDEDDENYQGVHSASQSSTDLQHTINNIMPTGDRTNFQKRISVQTDFSKIKLLAKQQKQQYSDNDSLFKKRNNSSSHNRHHTQELMTDLDSVHSPVTVGSSSSLLDSSHSKNSRSKLNNQLFKLVNNIFVPPSNISQSPLKRTQIQQNILNAQQLHANKQLPNYNDQQVASQGMRPIKTIIEVDEDLEDKSFCASSENNVSARHQLEMVPQLSFREDNSEINSGGSKLHISLNKNDIKVPYPRQQLALGFNANNDNKQPNGSGGSIANTSRSTTSAQQDTNAKNLILRIRQQSAAMQQSNNGVSRAGAHIQINVQKINKQDSKSSYQSMMLGSEFNTPKNPARALTNASMDQQSTQSTVLAVPSRSSIENNKQQKSQFAIKPKPASSGNSPSSKLKSSDAVFKAKIKKDMHQFGSQQAHNESNSLVPVPTYTIQSRPLSTLKLDDKETISFFQDDSIVIKQMPEQLKDNLSINKRSNLLGRIRQLNKKQLSQFPMVIQFARERSIKKSFVLSPDKLGHGGQKPFGQDQRHQAGRPSNFSDEYYDNNHSNNGDEAGEDEDMDKRSFYYEESSEDSYGSVDHGGSNYKLSSPQIYSRKPGDNMLLHKSMNQSINSSMSPSYYQSPLLSPQNSNYSNFSPGSGQIMNLLQNNAYSLQIKVNNIEYQDDAASSFRSNTSLSKISPTKTNATAPNGKPANDLYLSTDYQFHTNNTKNVDYAHDQLNSVSPSKFLATINDESQEGLSRSQTHHLISEKKETNPLYQDDQSESKQSLPQKLKTFTAKDPEKKQLLLTPENLVRLDGSGVANKGPRSITTMSVVSTKKDGKKMINQYLLMSQIGSGNYANVFACLNEKDKQMYAMKTINKRKLNKMYLITKKQEYNFVDIEMAILKKLDHPNVLCLKEIIDDPSLNKLYIVTELVKNGNLGEKIKKAGGKLDNETMRRYFRNIISALEYCHDCAGIIHRDIKPENILIDDQNNAKLADFGVSYIMIDGNDYITTAAGSNIFFSPQVCRGAKYHGRTSDVWALGVTLYYASIGKYPFAANNFPELYRSIENDQPPFSEDIDPDLNDLLRKMLDKEEETRIKIEDIKKHPWVTNNGEHILPSLENKEKIKVTEKDLKSVFTKVRLIARVMLQFRKEREENQRCLSPQMPRKTVVLPKSRKLTS